MQDQAGLALVEKKMVQDRRGRLRQAKEDNQGMAKLRKAWLRRQAQSSLRVTQATKVRKRSRKSDFGILILLLLDSLLPRECDRGHTDLFNLVSLDLHWPRKCDTDKPLPARIMRPTNARQGSYV